MKKMKLLLCALLVAAMVLSIGASAQTYTDEEIAAIALSAQRALDIQAVENLMSRHVLYHCYGEHRAEMEEIWVQEPANQATASFGQNQGYYVGYDAIWEAYVEGHDSSWLETAKAQAEKLGIDISDMTDEEILETYGGMGQLLLHVTTTAIIEVAEDGQTAKGYWYSPGMIAESGQSANTIWEAYGADFIKENGEWKLWHLHMYTDFMCAFGDTFTSTSGSDKGMPGNGGPDGNGAPGNSEPPEMPEGGFPDGEAPEMPEGGFPEGEAPGFPGSEENAPADVGEAEETVEETTASAETVTGGQIAYEGESGAKEQAYASDSYVFSTQYTEFSATRLRSEMEVVPFPLPYETFSFDDDNFCPSVEEYALAGVDVAEWAAAQNV